MPASKSYIISDSGLLTPSYPSMLDTQHHTTPVPSGSRQPGTPELNMDELDRELECISQISTTELHEEVDAELDAEFDEVIRSPAARAAWEDVQDEVDSMHLSVSSGSARSRRSSRSSVGDRAPIYPDPIGTPRKSTSLNSSVTSSWPGPETPLNSTTFQDAPPPEKRERRDSGVVHDHPCVAFWQHCTPEHLATMEQFVALWIRNGIQLVERDWRSLEVSEKEKENTSNVYEGLLEQYTALRAYRLYRSRCTAEQLLDELSV